MLHLKFNTVNMVKYSNKLPFNYIYCIKICKEKITKWQLKETIVTDKALNWHNTQLATHLHCQTKTHDTLKETGVKNVVFVYI